MNRLCWAIHLNLCGILPETIVALLAEKTDQQLAWARAKFSLHSTVTGLSVSFRVENPAETVWAGKANLMEIA